VSAVSTISKRRTLRPVYGYSEARERRRKHMRGRPGSVRSLEEFGRVRLSASFFMRDFLHSEIANFHGIPNIPDDPDLAIAAGRKLCVKLLEPLQATFGRLAIRSAYRAPAVNDFGNRHTLSCAS